MSFTSIQTEVGVSFCKCEIQMVLDNGFYLAKRSNVMNIKLCAQVINWLNKQSYDY